MSPGWVEAHREWPDASDYLAEAPRASSDGELVVKFTLSYDGPLYACSSHQKHAEDKQALRREFSYQLRQVWNAEPALASRLKHYDEFEVAYLERTRQRLTRHRSPSRPAPYGMVKFELNGFCFVPLVTAQNNLWCELEITIYRDGDPGHILIKNGNDLDGHVKFLFDALRMPQKPDELAGDTPSGNEPFFTVLEDDRLITRLSIDTKRRIWRKAESQAARNAYVTVGVNVLARKLTDINRDLLV